ncbi:cystinosin [Holotrichia oblita]|uniref:Cystinosin n=1 Tax=Holotrichia oblita TaxID=644536 RepID=A0ACB9TX73_HOLOL|nr:cystinosin [Holotrichia oblita]
MAGLSVYMFLYQISSYILQIWASGRSLDIKYTTRTFNVKYFQAIMNYRRKSTDGWSIEAVLLDIVGGLFSVLQMFMNAYNYDEDLAWILKNPAKLWLGISSLLFDLLFVVQHYWLYNKKSKTKRQDESDVKAEMAIPLNQLQKLQERD